MAVRRKIFAPREYGLIARLAAVLLLLFAAPVAFAQEPTEAEQAVENGGEALQESGRYPWYDAREDGVRTIPLANSGDADSKNRDSKWTSQPKTGRPWTFGGFGFFGTLLNGLGVALLILFLGLIAYLIAKAFLKDETSDGVTRKFVETSRDVDRVEALPFKIRKPTGDFLSEARRLYEAGEYSEAVIYYFSYQLVELDRHHVLRLAKGKTNRQYLREVRQRPVVRSILEATMITFEDSFFGRKAISRQQFENCWNRLSDFQGELARLERAAAA
ncbi:MAG TPA: DUF4129 domain-containing protein [Pirellulaceae bacterium]|nr:DUF4129 domain-containing protein [Pirellulaceae bacterium]